MQTSWGPEFVTDPTADVDVHPVDEEMAREADAEEDGLQQPPPRAPDRASLSRALRELEASKARIERDAKRAQAEMRASLVLQLLPVLDNLDRTIAAARQNRDAPTVIEGVWLVRRQIAGVLESYGVQRIEATNVRFDPTIHEAVSMATVDDPRHDKIVIEQLEPGYMMGDRLLRPAKVVVGRARYH